MLNSFASFSTWQCGLADCSLYAACSVLSSCFRIRDDFDTCNLTSHLWLMHVLSFLNIRVMWFHIRHWLKNGFTICLSISRAITLETTKKQRVNRLESLFIFICSLGWFENSYHLLILWLQDLGELITKDLSVCWATKPFDLNSWVKCLIWCYLTCTSFRATSIKKCWMDANGVLPPSKLGSLDAQSSVDPSSWVLMTSSSILPPYFIFLMETKFESTSDVR